MFPDKKQQAAQIYHACAIEQQTRDRSASCRRPSEQRQCVPTPAEMLRPPMQAWMIQRKQISCNRVQRLLENSLEVVTALTGKSKVIKRVRSSGSDRNDMLNRERVRADIQRTMTILATGTGALNHFLTYSFRNITTRHGWNRYLIAALPHQALYCAVWRVRTQGANDSHEPLHAPSSIRRVPDTPLPSNAHLCA